MSMTMTLVLMVQILAALVMAGLILLQHGKGADMGAAFGSGSSGSLFGATGGANFLSRMTALCATVFFAATLVLAYLGSQGMQRPAEGGGSSVLDSLPASSAPAPLPESGPASAIPGAAAPATPPATASSAPVAGAEASGANAIPDAAPTQAPAVSEPAAPPASADAPAAAQPAAGEAATTGNAAAASQDGAAAAPGAEGGNNGQ